MSRLRDLIRAMEEEPDVDGIWDYEGRIAALVPPPDEDLTDLITTGLAGLDTQYLATTLRIFATKSHTEIAPFAMTLLADPVVSTRIEAAAALAIIGDARGLNWLEAHARRGRDPDLLEVLEELADHVTSRRLPNIQRIAMSHG